MGLDLPSSGQVDETTRTAKDSALREQLATLSAENARATTSELFGVQNSLKSQRGIAELEMVDLKAERDGLAAESERHAAMAKALEAERDRLGYDADGAVVKVDDISSQDYVERDLMLIKVASAAEKRVSCW